MRRFVPVVPLVWLASCGYVGPVQPPSPEIPAVITDLNAVERGDKIIITFTTPARTTDGVAITRFSHVDLRIGPDTQPPDSDKSIAVEPPSPSDREDPQPNPIAYSADVAEWDGQHIGVSVRTAMKKTGHFSAWSNRAVLNVIAPLPKPVVVAQPSAKGLVLEWPTSEANQYRVLRQGPNDKQQLDLATVTGNTYTDVSAQFDTDYRYVVIAKKDAVESLPSETVSVNFPDIYPPADPTGLTALVGPDSIDLAWQRNTESDLQGYYIYRSSNSGPFQRIGNLVTLPTYSDHSAEHGKNYAYKISAVDKTNHESGASPPTEVQF